MLSCVFYIRPVSHMSRGNLFSNNVFFSAFDGGLFKMWGFFLYFAVYADILVSVLQC